MTAREDLGSIIFTTVFEDSHRVITFNGLLVNWSIRPSNASLYDPCVTSFDKQLAAHHSHVEKQQGVHGTRKALSLQETLNWTETFWTRDWEQMRRDGLVIETPTGDRYSLASAVKMALNIVWRGSSMRAARKARRVNQASQKEQLPSVEAELLLYEMENKRKPQSLQTWAKLTFFGISVGLFAISLVFDIGGKDLLLIVLVLFLHELGHLFAMHFFKVRDLNILFIPFLGAVATGSENRLSASQHIWMLLAGPLPGIVLGIFLSSTQLPLVYPDVDSFISYLLWINAFNLLPIIPLDGGRIVQTLLGARFIRLGIAFQLLSFTALTLMGIFTNWILLIIGGIGFWSTLRLNRRTLELGKLHLSLKKEIFSEIENTHIVWKAIIERMHQGKLATLSLFDRLVHGRQLAEDLQRREARIWQRLSFAFLYASLFVVLPYASYKLPSLRDEELALEFAALKATDHVPEALVLGNLLLQSQSASALLLSGDRLALYQDVADLQIQVGQTEEAKDTLIKGKEETEFLLENDAFVLEATAANSTEPDQDFHRRHEELLNHKKNFAKKLLVFGIKEEVTTS